MIKRFCNTNTYKYIPCLGCKHFDNNTFECKKYLNNIKNIDIVNGTDMYLSAKKARNDESYCGLEAKYFNYYDTEKYINYKECAKYGLSFILSLVLFFQFPYLLTLSIPILLSVPTGISIVDIIIYKSPPNKK